MKKASSILAVLIMAGVTAGWWLDTRSRPAAPEQAASRAMVAEPKPLAVQTKPQLKLIRAAHRNVTEIDVREAGKDGTPLLQDRLLALAALRAGIPGSTVEFDPITGAPSQIQATGSFLSGRNAGRAAREVVGSFIDEHAALFGHGSAALNSARVTRDDVTPHSGMSTVVWNQEVDGVPVFKTILKASLTKHGELITINDHFVADPMPNRAAPAISAEKAVYLAASSVQTSVTEGNITAQGQAQGRQRHQAFMAPGISDTSAQLTYLPMNERDVRLGWDVTLFSIDSNEMFRSVVDAESGVVLYRTTLTSDISNAAFRVYGDATSKKPFDSPRPMTPGHATPQSTEPAEVPSQLITLPALDTTASPNGWINDGNQETLGNNVDAHTDTDANNSPDLPRPNGGTTRTFDVNATLSLAPSTYKDAAVVNLFYVCNWVHDRLYQLGFTESAGNFQTDNFGRGGLGNDAILADAQDGSGTNNANFSTPPDGSPGRLQMYLWTAPDPDRDASFDAHTIIHEYVHGLSGRLVGGGVGMSGAQTMGLGEGWSDFYALCLTSDPSQDPNAVYPIAPYSARLVGDAVDSNYYFGIRRYPYCTDLAKNPLTFKDIDYRQAGAHLGVPLSPRYSSATSGASLGHAVGEIWCCILWDVRAALISKHGRAPGNERVLQLVTDGMKLSPVNPTFIQARDAILQADLVLTGGADAADIIAAFARRGLGVEATAPSYLTTLGVVESFDLPDALKVTPLASITFDATRITGPTFPASQTFTVKNTGSTAVTWSAACTQSWLGLAPAGGTLAPGATVLVQGTVAASVVNLPAGTYANTVTFTNTATGVVRKREATLNVNPLLARTASFNLDVDPMWTREGEWAFGVPTGAQPEYAGREPSSGFTGNNVFGIVLTGAYGSTPGSPAYLTSSPINTTGMQNVTLRFRRWLNQQVQPATYATVDVSTDGINWTTVWQNSSNDHVVESGWSTQTYALGAMADNQPTVYVRWGHRVAMPTTAPMGGWNLDDIEFLSETTTPGLTATTQNFTTAVNTPVSLTLGGINASNPAAPQVVNVLGLPAHGTLTGTVPNLIYTPNPGFSGVDTFPFTVTSEGTTSTPANIVITVLPGPPDASVEFPDGTELADDSGVADFGAMPVGLFGPHQFLVKNVSGGPLNLFSTRVDGPHAFEFTVGSPGKSLLAPGESTYLPVVWAPRFVGAKHAVLHILTNDPDESSYDIIINGTGTAFDGGVRLTKDLNTGSANINSLRNVRGNLMFVATGSTNQTTLWTSQGTPETTVSVEDVLLPGTIPTSPTQFTVVGNRAYFFTSSGSGGTLGLWTTDGTLGGSYLYSNQTWDINNRPSAFTALGEHLIFSAGSSAAQGAELWRSNGSVSGTYLLKEINANASTGSQPGNMKAFNGFVWFTANDGTNGVELWRTDGTPAGTVLVKDIDAGANSSSPTLLNGAGSTLFFSATTAANGRELYKSDGTSAGTTQVRDIIPGPSSSLPSSMVPFGNDVLFGANNGAVGIELWKSDGTLTGTQMVKDIQAGSGSSNAAPRLVINNMMLLTATDGTTGTELWKSDGTPTGTVLVKDLQPGSGSSNPTNFVQAGDLAYFTATTTAHGTELWRTDGTEAGTVLVSDLNPGASSSSPANLTVVGSKLYFTAFITSLGTELFVLDLGPAPEIAVELMPGQDLAHAAATVDFGSQPVVNGRSSRMLLIKNLGTQPLLLSEVAINGADAASFTLSSTLAGTHLPAGRSVAAGVTFNTASAGSKSASLQIISNDPDEPAFDIALTGTGITAPEIVVERSNGADLLDDVSSVMIGDAPQGLQVTDTFTVRNIGSSTLTLGTPTIDGTNATSFSATAPGGTSLPPGGSTSFSITFSPTTLGAHRAALHLTSSDTDEPSFDIFLTGTGSFAPGPLKLQRDINRQGAGFTGTVGAVVGSTYYFASNTSATGTELWKTDATTAGTIMVRDIAPGTVSSTPANLTPMNGLLYFTANDGTNGTELWRSDGSTAGTVMVKNINPGSSSATPANLVVMNGLLYFTANDGITGAELWKSDGTSDGTVLVKDFNPGTASGGPSQITVMNNTLYLVATDGVAGAELWKSDGTTAGTALVKDINTTSANTSSTIANLRAAGSQLFFTAKDGVNGNELWRSDGTSAGTSLVADISPGATDSAFFSFTVSGTLAYFMTSPDGLGSYAGPGQEIWRSDGTTAGTFMLADIRSGYLSSTITSITPDGLGGVYFSANNAIHGFELWKSDGSNAGTQMVKDINPGAASSSPVALTLVNGMLYFSATTSAGAELWRSDGSEPGTFMLREMNAGDASASPTNIIGLGGHLIFTASNGGDGPELWAVAADGTAPRALRDAAPGSTNSNPIQFNVINEKLCFMAVDDYTGMEMWVDDGTSTGPRLLKDIKPGTASGLNGQCRLVETMQENSAMLTRTLFFSGDDGQSGPELWRTDGTTAGTYMVKNIFIGTSGSNPTQLVNVSGRLFFAASSAAGGSELWTSDGTDAGTRQVANINQTFNGTGGSSPNNLTAVGATVFFSANDGINGNELWKSDGGSTGTVMVKDLTPGSASTAFGLFATARGLLFFVADNGTAGAELWVSDGTVSGTFMLQDINTSATVSGGASITSMAAHNDLLLFNAYHPTYGNELWRSDGTSAGTFLLKDIYAGISGSVPSNFKASGGSLYFTALTAANGVELWKTDGTAAGTVIVKDIFPGSASSVPSGLADINGTLYFSAAASSTEGAELWKTDGTSAGTQLVVDVRPGAGLSSSPANITLMGTRLFFSATGTDTGVELFSYNLNPQPKLALIPASGLPLKDNEGGVDFGMVAPGQNTQQTFTLRNEGDAQLNTSLINLSGIHSQDFGFSMIPGTIAPSASTTFTITFTPGASGLRAASFHLSSNDPAASTFDAALTGRGLTNYEVASQDAGLPPAAENSDPYDDYDQDGQCNMIELAFGTPATTATGSVMSLSGASINSKGQPIAQRDGNTMRAVYLRRKDAAALGITYNLQFSANLGLWEPSSGAATIIAQDSMHEAVSVPFPATVAGQPARFFRVHVDLTP